MHKRMFGEGVLTLPQPADEVYFHLSNDPKSFITQLANIIKQTATEASQMTSAAMVCSKMLIYLFYLFILFLFVSECVLVREITAG